MCMNVGEIDAGHENSDPTKVVSEAEPKKWNWKVPGRGATSPQRRSLFF